MRAPEAPASDDTVKRVAGWEVYVEEIGADVLEK